MGYVALTTHSHIIPTELSSIDNDSERIKKGNKIFKQFERVKTHAQKIENDEIISAIDLSDIGLEKQMAVQVHLGFFTSIDDDELWDVFYTDNGKLVFFGFEKQTHKPMSFTLKNGQWKAIDYGSTDVFDVEDVEEDV